MSKSKYVFLVSDGIQVMVSYTRPQGLIIKNGKWKVRIFSISIGQAISTSGDWTGPVGVYDTTVQQHIINLAQDMRGQSLALAGKRINNRIHSIFGDKVSLEVMGHLYNPNSGKRHEQKLTAVGELLLNTQEAVNGVCFQNK